MLPLGLSGQDTEDLLSLLNDMGILVWLEQSLRHLVMLNPKKLAVAMARLMTVCFGAENFEHGDDIKKSVEDVCTSAGPQDVRRFRSTGVATKDLIERVWEKEFEDQDRRQFILEVLLRRNLICPRLVQGEFVVPSCLPVAHCAEERFTETDAALYLDLGGLLSPNFFPDLSRQIYSVEKGSETLTPGPPQVFRNLGDLHSNDCSVFTSLFPGSARDSSKSLLRILVKGDSKDTNMRVAQEVKKLLLEDVMGFQPGFEAEQDPIVFFSLQNVGGSQMSFEDFYRCTPCLDSRCAQTCLQCMLWGLLQERSRCDLSEHLHGIVKHAAFQRHTRPSGSFRFSAMSYPGDVDLEEYLVVTASKPAEAFKELARLVKAKVGGLSKGGSQIFFKGLKAGSKSQNKDESKKEWLTWSQEEIQNGTKDGIELEEALEQGHESWTAKMDLFAKVRLFEDAQPERFFEITNVLRVGYLKEGQIQTITKEKDFLHVVEICLVKYSGEEPNVLKYIKRLWERSAYLAQRGFDLAWHVTILKSLKPLLCHWAAELCQMAAHVETLTKMLKCSDLEVLEHARSDLPILRQSLKDMETRLKKVQEKEKRAAQDGLESIQEALKYIAEDASADEKRLCKAQLLLESCVETVLISELGSFESPVAKRLGGRWEFPSDHPPIAANLSLRKHSIKVVSWNVLNRHYYKYIDLDTQGLKDSLITRLHQEGSREVEIVRRIREMMGKDFRIVCLQECWPELLIDLQKDLDQGPTPKFHMACTGQSTDKNQEVIIYHEELKLLNMKHHAYKSNPKKVVTEALFALDGTVTLRAVTTHVPGDPFGPARREFADCLVSIVYGEELPTVLLADLNFPEKAVQPLLLDRGLEDVYFVPIPYPTNICQGSLLPKRIDSIAVINHKVQPEKQLKATKIEPEELLEGLEQVVKLLKSRSAEPLTPVRYQSDKVALVPRPPTISSIQHTSRGGFVRRCTGARGVLWR
ncbi:Protein NLRC3 [Durusdinium trenchii]|uniref:Protein NLRC3 n=1 Tax=Durusdinium trenchii TaxID=1381693 RepID=A0ABP0KG89_9DINO